MNKSYTEMLQFPTLLERFNYLKLGGAVGIDTFGYMRFMNQEFYQSTKWKKFRRDIILRDNGCELGISDYSIFGPIYIHHINPISENDLIMSTDALVDPDNAVCVSRTMHNAIHYGNDLLIPRPEIVRKPNDTIPWR